MLLAVACLPAPCSANNSTGTSLWATSRITASRLRMLGLAPSTKSSPRGSRIVIVGPFSTPCAPIYNPSLADKVLTQDPTQRQDSSKSTANTIRFFPGQRLYSTFTAMFSKVYKPEPGIGGRKPTAVNLHVSVQKRKYLPNRG